MANGYFQQAGNMPGEECEILQIEITTSLVTKLGPDKWCSRNCNWAHNSKHRKQQAILKGCNVQNPFRPTSLWLFAMICFMACPKSYCTDQEMEIVVIDGSEFQFLDWHLNSFWEKAPEFDVQSTSNWAVLKRLSFFEAWRAKRFDFLFVLVNLAKRLRSN